MKFGASIDWLKSAATSRCIALKGRGAKQEAIKKDSLINQYMEAVLILEEAGTNENHKNKKLFRVSA